MSLEERLNALEQKLKLYRWLFLGVSILSVVLAGTSALAIQERVVRANRFILEDSKGETCGLFYMAKNGPSLTLFDPKGEPRVMLSIRESGPALTLMDDTGEKFIGLSEGPFGLLLDIFGGPKLGYAAVSVTKDGAKVTLDDKFGHHIWTAP